MRRLLWWSGVTLCVVGGGVIVATTIMSYMGLNPSFNLGDPTKFEFVLVPVWQIGVGLAGLGALCILASRLLNRNPENSAAI